MAKYKIFDSVTGKSLTVESDTPPTEADAPAIFAQAGLRDTTPQPQAQELTPFNLSKAIASNFLSPALTGDKAIVDTERKFARGIGNVGKAATESISDISPLAGKVAGFVLPQDEVGGQAALAGPAVGAGVEALAASRAGQAAAAKIAGFGEGISEGAKNILRYAESKGIPLSAADISQSKTLQSVENFLEKTPLGSEQMRQFRDRQIAAIRALRDKLAEKFGTSEDASVLGKIAQDAVASESKAARDQANLLYGKVGELAAGKEIPMERTANTALDLIEKEMKLRPELRNQNILKMAADTLGIHPQMINEDTLPFIRENAGAFTSDYANWSGTRRMLGDIIDTNDAARALGQPGVKFMSSAEAGAAKALYKTASEDLATFAKSEGGALKEAHDAASDFYKNGVETFNDRAVKQMLRANPEKVIDTVFRPGVVTPIRAVKQALGGDTRGWRALKSQFVEKILPEVGDKMTPQTFQNALDKYGDATLREIFTPQELMQFRGLAKLSQTAGKSMSLAGTQGSARTNTVLASGGIAGGLIVHNPVTGIPGAAGVLLGPKAIAKLYLSDTGRDLLLKGFTIPSTSPKAAGTAAAITTYLGLKAAGGSENTP